jgi:uncharacterized protein (DUF2141 family)
MGAKIILALLAAVALRGWAPAQPTAENGTIVLRIEGLNSDKGLVRYGLHSSKESFDAALRDRRGGREGACKIVNRLSECRIQGVAYGVYALLVGHDENEDDEISVIFPRESSGASNYTSRLWWYPDFDKAKFEHRSETTYVTVRVF